MTEPDEGGAGTAEGGDQPTPAPAPTPDADDPLLPAGTADDTDAGWGERGSGFDDDHYLRDVPPHHGA